MYICNKCNDTIMFTEKKGPSIGLYCQSCGAWQKWLGKDEVKVFKYNNNKAIKEKERNIKRTERTFKSGNQLPFGNLEGENSDIDIDLENSTVNLEIPIELLKELISHLDNDSKDAIIKLLED